MSATIRAARRAPLLQVVKSAVATSAAWLIVGFLIPGPPPVFAAIAALLVVQPSLNQSLTRAIERSVGVIAGVVIASVLSILLGSATWVILLTTIVALLIAWALRMTPGHSCAALPRAGAGREPQAPDIATGARRPDWHAA